MSHFTPEQQAEIHEANEKFKLALLKSGNEGQIIDETSPEREEAMRRFVALSAAEHQDLMDKFIQENFDKSKNSAKVFP
jgi:hypothetical protein